MLSAKQEGLMVSEWVKLTDKDGKDIYVNLANASSISPKKGGSEIWFLGGAGNEGRVHVEEPPEKVLALVDEVKSATRPRTEALR
jgi:hypothetical protein